MASPDGTWRYRDRHHESFARTYFRPYGDLAISSIGLGTYLGEPTDAVDAAYRETIATAIDSGCNVLDTAINYRHQRSERAVGDVLDRDSVDREEVFVATKGGFVPFDGHQPADPGQYVREEYVDTGLIERDQLVRGQHCIAPAFLDDQIERSLSNLGVDRIDCYYVHNPETQLLGADRETVYDRLEAAFERLEARVADGDLRTYGVATWDGLRVPADHAKHLSLPAIYERAQRAGDRVGDETCHFRAVQLPFNVEMADAFTVRAHDGQSALWAAHERDLAVFTSATLQQGALADGLPEAVAAELTGETAAQRAITFARSAPGVHSALVGASTHAHVEENVAAGTYDPLGANAFDAIFE